MHLLFDFDGTLVDSFDCVIEKTNHLARKFSFDQIAPEDAQALRDLSALAILKKLRVPLYKVPMLISQMRKELRREMSTLCMVEGLKPVLRQCHEAGYTLGILTSNAVENVNAWLKLNALDDLFSLIHSEHRYLSKRRLIKNVLAHYKIRPEEALYICDEARDIEAAHQNNLPVLAVTWGYNSEKIITTYAPEGIIRKPVDLIAVVKNALPS